MQAQLFSLVKDVKWTVVENAAAAGTTDLETDILDMAGFESVAFLLHTGTLTDTGTVTLDFYENTANSTSGSTKIDASSTATLTGLSNNGDNKLWIAERIRPTKRYVYAVVNRGTANCVVNSVIAAQYGATETPVTQPASVVRTISSAGN